MKLILPVYRQHTHCGTQYPLCSLYRACDQGRGKRKGERERDKEENREEGRKRERERGGGRGRGRCNSQERQGAGLEANTGIVKQYPLWL